MATRSQLVRLTCLLVALMANPLTGQEEPHTLRLKSRTIETGRGVRTASANSSGRAHFLAQTDGNSLDLARLTERDIRVLGYLPDNGVAISSRADEDLSGLGFRWVGEMEPADRRGFPDTASPQDDTPSFYVVEFFSDADMGRARSDVLSQQIGIRENPSLLAIQLLVIGTRAQMVSLSNQETVVYIFPASEELVQGIPVTACVSGNTPYGLMLPIASSLSAGWSLNSNGVANLTYSFGRLTSKIPADTVKQLFVQVLRQWSGLVKVSFTESGGRTGARNVDLGFYSGDHGDQFPFDGPGGVLAHTFYPAPPNSEPVAGDMHMDADETWTNSGSGTDFYSVALHELGHALGLGHSTSPLDVMYPFYRHNTTFSPNDINAIQGLYPPQDATVPPPPAPPALTVQPVAAQAITSTIPLTGSASGGQGAIRVTWTTDRGGLGTAQGSATWTVAAVPLALGRNTITVKAQDDASTIVSQTVVVDRIDTPPPPPPPPTSPQAPTIQITQPGDGTVTTTSLTTDMKGTAMHPAGIRSISWRSSLGASGIAQGTTSWATGLVGLQIGVNSVTVDAVSLDGATASKSVQITVTATPGAGETDTTPPTLAILTPSTTSFVTSDSAITIKGTAIDNVDVSVVRWETPVAGGVATGTANWSTGPIPLLVGMNNIVIRAYDPAGNTSWRSVSVTRQ